METSDVLAIIAATLAVASFGAEIWRLWRDRPRLVFYIHPTTFKGLPKIGDLKMMCVMVANTGYRPIVLTGFRAFGEHSAFSMGIHDEPAAIYGLADQKFPVSLKPGETHVFHPMAVDAFERNQSPDRDDGTRYDPYRCFVLFDSFDRMHPLDASDVSWRLGLSKSWRKKKGLERIMHRFERWRFIRQAVKRFSD